MFNRTRMFTALFVASFAGAIILLPAAAKADSWFSCQPTEVIELSNRIHVRCSNTITAGTDVVRYLAVGKTDTNAAARFISLANAALLSGKIFRVIVPTSSATNIAGCLTTDCRTPTTFGVMN